MKRTGTDLASYYSAHSQPQCASCKATFSTVSNRNKHQKKCEAWASGISRESQTQQLPQTQQVETRTASPPVVTTQENAVNGNTTTVPFRQESFPEEYSNPDALVKWVPHRMKNTDIRRTPNYDGSSKSKILKIWPHFKNLFLGRRTNAFDRLSLNEQEAIRQGNVASRHIGQGSDSVMTVLGQFHHFMKEHNEGSLLVEGSYDVLAAFPRIHAFLKFLQLWGYRSATVRNKAAVLKSCLKHLQSLPHFALGTSRHTRLVTAMKTCERWRSNMKANGVTERSQDCNEEQLIAEGKFFKPPEDLAFFRWLIRKVTFRS